MAVLADNCAVLPLREAVRRLLDGTLPPRAVCVTFDDGYRNNLQVAAPVLKRFGIPATVFITQRAIETGIMWNDLVIEALRCAQGTVDLSHLGLGTVDMASVERPDRFVLEVLKAFKYRPLQERWNIARELHDRCARRAPPRLMLDEPDLRELTRCGVELGAHTVNHPILAKLPPEEAMREIVDCADWLAGVTGERPRSFAYPNGRPGTDFNGIHMRQAREAGFELAVSTEWNCASKGSDAFALPRVSYCSEPAGRLAWNMGRSFLASRRAGNSYAGN
jgi:peptidoglycan/xylan/chitin deacetylase (PgdA/CDA1 family)